MAEYKGYTGSQKFGLSTSAVTAYATAKQEEIDKKKQEELEKALEEQQKAQNLADGKKEDGTAKGLLDKAKDLGKGLVGGLQQAGGLLGDVALGGGELIDELATQTTSGISEKERDELRVKKVANTEALRKKLHGLTDINGNKIQGTSNVDEAATRISQGKGDGKDFAAVAGKGLETGLAATTLVNPVNLARGAVGGATARQLAVDLGKTSVGLGGATGVETGLESLGEGKNLGESAVEAGKAAVVGTVANAALGGLGIAGGKVIAKVKGQKGKAANATDTEVTQASEVAGKQLALSAGFRKTDDVVADIDKFQKGEFTPEDDVWKDTPETSESTATQDVEQLDQTVAESQAKVRDLSQQLDEISAANKANPDNADLATYNNAAKALQDAADELEAAKTAKASTGTIDGSTSRELDPQKVKDQFKALKDELEASKSYENGLRQAGIDDAPTRSPDEIDAEAEALNNGQVPEDFYDAPKLVEKAEDIALHENLPEPLKQAGNLLATDKAYAQNQLSQLLTPEAGKEVLKSLDDQYMADLATLEGLPEARAAIEKENMTNDYLDQVDEIQAVMAEDAPAAKQAQATLDSIIEKEKELVSDVNGFQAEYFDDYKTLNEERVSTRLAELEQEKALSNTVAKANVDVNEAAVEGKFQDVAEASPTHMNEARDETVGETDFDNYKQASPVVQALIRIMSPSKVFEAMGLRDLHTKIFQASGRMIKANNEDLALIKDVSKSIDGNKQLADSIIDYLEGNTDTISTGNKELADKVKSFFDTKGEALKKMGYATREDYFPHIFNKDDKVVQRLFGNKATGTVNFGNLKQRTTEGGDFSRDVIAVMSKYAQGFNRKVYLEPALKPLESLRTQAELTNAEGRFVNDYLNQLQNKNRSGVEEGINAMVDSLYGKESKNYGENHLRKALGAQRMVSAVATMGGNLSTVVRNMSQMVNTGATLNPKWATAGMLDAIRTLPNRKSELFKELQDSGVFEGGVSKNYNIDMEDLSIGSKAAEGAKKGVDLLMSGIRASDVLLRSQAYLGARAKYLAKNPGDIEGAKASAIEAVIDTQFVTSNIDNAVALNGPMVRSLTQLATFSVKQAEYLTHMGIDIVKKDANGNYGFANAEAAGRALTFVMGAGLTVSALGPVIGMKPQEFIPFADQLSEGSLYRSPLISVLFGDGKSRQGLNETVSKTFNEEARGDETVDEVWQKFWDGNWSQLVPAGSQIKKSTEGLESATTGQSKNASGKTRFLQDTDDGTKLQSLLFGQYATKAGQNWVNSGMNTLSEAQTKQLEGLSPEKQKQYYDYYQAAKNTTGRDDAVAKIKEAAKAGNLNEAARLGAEYNAKVTKAMGSYWKTNTSLPERLEDEMTSTLYVDVQKTVDSLDTKKSQKTLDKEAEYLADDEEE